jgi:hypothetical protein
MREVAPLIGGMADAEEPFRAGGHCSGPFFPVILDVGCLCIIMGEQTSERE